ncbi:hypothetical protein PNEG_01748 [Pneumocystis murina B123]|uniref:BAR domain-containing protein n=1 Tax=Pneumocystis murina (strain B123) TaxID=1069680 RepID=M7P7Y6_PNEMU|nr:hypothetical protein PNEG_01748 [Pneumocystis murina B123]EMR09990.1 hypothetical protein PNEG_01748 [Pneumocystis murina B123]
MQKKIGRLGQWTKEMLGKEQRTQTTDEFKELEQEMQMRHEGIENIYSSINQWAKSMLNRREDKKHTLIDLFSQALLSFGEKFSPESVYGQGLLKYGIAHKEISKEQERLINGISNNILESMERSLVQFKDYQTARKKLESRRLSYDSVSNRFIKAKKEDPRIEEELRAAKAKYEEACESIYGRIYSIQQAETTQLNDLTFLLDLEFRYYEQCYMIIQNLKESWAEINNAYEASSKYVKHQQISAHAFNNGGENTINRLSLPFRSGMSALSLERKISEIDLNSPKQISSFRATPTRIPPESPNSIEDKNTQDTASLKLEQSFKTDEQDASILSNGNAPVIPPRTYERFDRKDNTSSTKHYSTLKNSSVRNFYTTYKNVSEDNSLSSDENKNIYSENHLPEFPNTFSNSDDPTLKSYSDSKSTSKINTLEFPIIKTRKPPIPSQFLQDIDSSKLNNTCKNCNCDDYQESFFKKGQCNQCFHIH